MEIKTKLRIVTSERQLPNYELLQYKCSQCDTFIVAGDQPFFRALQKQSDHNKIHHPKEFPPAKLVMVYKI